MRNGREDWEWELTRVIDIARKAGLDDVVLAIQTSIGKINILKQKADDLQKLKEILR